MLSVGTGPSLVMLHGVSLAAAVWAPLLAELGGYRAHLVELPGHGLSGPAAYRPGAVRDHTLGLLDDLLDALGLTTAPVAGHAELGQITAPTMFCWGSGDPFLTPARARPAIDQIPGAVLHEVPGGHAPWLEDPAGCAKPVTEHLAETGYAPAA